MQGKQVCVPQLLSLHSRGQDLQLRKPMHLEPMLHNKRSHHDEKPAHCNERVTPACHNHRKAQVQHRRPSTATNINKQII